MMAPKKATVPSPLVTRARRAAANKAVEKIHNINKPKVPRETNTIKTTTKRTSKQTVKKPAPKVTKKKTKNTPKTVTKTPPKSRDMKTSEAAIIKALEPAPEIKAPIPARTTRSGRSINAPKTFGSNSTVVQAVTEMAAPKRGTKRAMEPDTETQPPMKKTRHANATLPLPTKPTIKKTTKRVRSQDNNEECAPSKRRRVAKPAVPKEPTLKISKKNIITSVGESEMVAEPKNLNQPPTVAPSLEKNVATAPAVAARIVAVATPTLSSPPPVAESTPQHPQLVIDSPILGAQTVAADSATPLPASPSPPPAGESTSPPPESSAILEESSIDLMKGPISFVDFSEDVYEIARYHPIPRPSVSVAGNDSSRLSIASALSAPRTPFSPRRRRRHGSAEVRKHFENPDPPTGRKFIVRGYDPRLDTPPVMAASAPTNEVEPTPPPIVMYFPPAPTIEDRSKVQKHQKELQNQEENQKENKENSEVGDRSVGRTYGFPDESLVSTASVGRTYGVPDYSITDTSFFSAASG